MDTDWHGADNSRVAAERNMKLDLMDQNRKLRDENELLRLQLEEQTAAALLHPTDEGGQGRDALASVLRRLPRGWAPVPRSESFACTVLHLGRRCLLLLCARPGPVGDLEVHVRAK